MSNYPPGVSGNEPQIAGPLREVTEERECKSPERTVGVVGNEFDMVLARLEGTLSEAMIGGVGEHTLEALGHLVQQLKGTAKNFEFDECPFVGDVDVAYFRDEAFWTCPVCGDEHRIEADEFEDPDL